MLDVLERRIALAGDGRCGKNPTIPGLLFVRPTLLRKQLKHFHLVQIAIWDGGKN